MMGFLILLTFSVLTGVCLIQVSCGDSSSWRSGPPDGLPELSKLSVDCGKEEMTIHLEFTAPYDGTIYSKSNGQSHRCIHVAPHSHITEATFSIDYHSCNTRSDSQGKFYENTIIIQYDDTVIEAWDEAKKIRCEWHDGYEKSAYKMPITISDLDVVEMNFQGDDVDCWLEVQDGKGPWSAKVEGLVPLGSPLTLVVAIQDSEGQFDMRVKSCIAHDGHKHPIHLTDEDGCVLRSKMMSPFQKTLDTKGTASVIAYSHFYAFKFPESVEVTIQCTVEICRHGCPDTCLQGRDAQTPSSGGEHLPAQGKDQDDIPTYKDSHPFSTVITSKPDKSNHSSSLNTSSIIALGSENNVTKEEPEPLKTSPDTHHDFYMNRYPFDLYDILEADERHDKNENQLYSNTDEEYIENTDDIYFSQIPNLYSGANEQGKNFPPNPEIKNVSNKTESYTDQPEISDANNGTVPSTTEREIIASVEILPTAEKFTDIKEENIDSPQTELDKGNKTEESEIINPVTENLATEKPELTENEPVPDLKSSEDQTLNQLLSSELFEDAADSNTAEAWEDSLHESSPSYFVPESLQKSKTAETPVEPISQSNDYNEASSEYKNKNKVQHYKYAEKRSNEDTMTKKLTDTSFEDYKVRARKPVDNDWKHNIHNFNYRPFMPPAPVPPLTLYNGVPLYYYNNPGQNAEFTERSGFQYSSGQPFHREYLKSKLRRPGRRRGRRQIGEKEQLGLKQTLRVVATTDFDFLIKDNDEPLYVGKSDIDREVCIAPSSFATGLGLLLLANICVLCIVVFLGHHYYIYRKIKVNNTELLCTEMT